MSSQILRMTASEGARTLQRAADYAKWFEQFVCGTCDMHGQLRKITGEPGPDRTFSIEAFLLDGSRVTLDFQKGRWRINGSPFVNEADVTVATGLSKDFLSGLVWGLTHVGFSESAFERKKVEDFRRWSVRRHLARDKAALTCSLYFIATASKSRVKIGVSTNVTRRMRDLQNQCGEELHLLGHKSGDEVVEYRLHDELKAHRLKGEWFTYCDAVLAVVNRELST